jgi:hypothetical protein
MKNSIKKTMIKYGLLFFLMMFTITGMAQVTGGQYTLSISSATATSNSIDVSLRVTLTNPSAGMRFTGYSTSINFNTAIINGGTISAVYVDGKDAALSGLATPAIGVATAGTVRLSFQAVSGANGIDMAQGSSLNLGKFRISNTANWSTANANLWLQNLLVTGKTNSAVQGAAFGTSTPVATYTTTLPTSPPGLILSHTSAVPYNLPVGQICATAGVVSTAGSVTCFGGSNGSATVTMSPIPTVSAITYTVDGGTSTSATLVAGAFNLTGLTAGSHSVVVSNSGCGNVTVPVTISGPAALTNTTAATACNTYIWSVTGATYTTSGTYSGTTTNGNGCSVAETLNLTINNSTTTASSVTACDSYTWFGTTYTTSGSYTNTTTNAAGCANVETLTLTINHSTTTASSATACDSYTWFGTTYTTSGSYTNTTSNAAGCPNVETLTLVINNSTTTASSATACDSYTWFGTTYTTSGSYTNTTTNAAGCPNVETLTLTITPSTSNTTAVSACDTYTWSVNSSVYTASGTYTATNGCHTEVLELTINSNTIVTQPSNAVICKAIGGTASFSVVAGTTSATYQWYTQIATSSTATWTVVPTNANYSGAGSSTLNVTRTTTAIPATGTKYRVVITGSCGTVTSTTAALQEQIVLSKAAVVTAKSSSNVALLPVNTTCNGNSVNLSLAAGSIGNIQWQSSTDGVSYTNLGSLVSQSALNAANPILTMNSGVLTQDTWFRVVASNGACSSVNGLSVKILVSPTAVAGAIAGGDVTVCASAVSALDLTGTLVPFSNSTTLTLNGNLGTIVWQKSINYTATVPTWAAVAGATTSTLTVVNLTVDTWYRAVVTSGACKATTDVTKITVSKVAKAGVVTATTNGAVTAFVCSGGAITFTSAAYVGTALQWEVSTTSATGGFAAVSGATGLAFTMTNVAYAPLSKFYVRNVVTSGACTIARSAVKTITVSTPSVAGTITGGGTVCPNGGATVSVTGNTGMIQWQYSTDGVTYMVAPYWKTVAGVPTYFNPSTEFTTAASTGIAATYVFTGLNTSGSVYFRAKVTNSVCSEVYTSAVAYVNGTAALAGTISAISTTLCPSTGTTLTLTGSLGTIQWQKATVSATTGLPGAFANIALQTGVTLPTGNLIASAAYQAVVTIGSCSTVTASYVIVTVVAAPIAKAITGSVTSPTGASAALALCNTNTSKVLTIGAGSIGAIQWETSTTSTTLGFATIAGATNVSYTVTSASVGANYFRAKFTNSCGAFVYSAVMTLYYKDCAPAKVIETQNEVLKTPFSAVAYPNPYTASFNLSLTTSSTEKVSIMVYDMTGRQLEQREVPSNSMMEQQLGDSYPTGVYNVIVTQGKQVKTLRVIKR